jgi:hypothetical protein
MDEGDGIAVAGGDRQRAATAGNRSGEVDDARRRGYDRRASRGAEIDAAMLSTGVRIVSERKWSEHRPVHGPGPGECGRRAGLEREEDRKQQAQTHDCSSSLSLLETQKSLAGEPDVVKVDDATAIRGTGGCARFP